MGEKEALLWKDAMQDLKSFLRCPNEKQLESFFLPRIIPRSLSILVFFCLFVSLASSHLLSSEFTALGYFSIVPECCFKSWCVYLFSNKGFCR